MSESTGNQAREWRTSDFDYHLPAERIAQTPLADRAASRVMLVEPGATDFPERPARELGAWLRPGDLLVANNSRVIPARLHARKPDTSGRVEFLLLREDISGTWTALAKPSRRLKPGQRLLLELAGGELDPGQAIQIQAVGDEGQVQLRFDPPRPELSRFGEMPLPPYITTRLTDAERYQTVYSREPGSAAAPTAGLHMTPDLIAALRNQGIGWTEVTLHVGLDTFRPVTVENVSEHHIHREWCSVSDEAARRIAETRMAGGRVIAVGTTSARTLETLGQVWKDEQPTGFSGESAVFITPSYRWRLVDGLLTNFHLPRSTLLMMVSALAGVETIRLAYATAVEREFRFFSFGDAMLILPRSERC